MSALAVMSFSAIVPPTVFQPDGIEETSHWNRARRSASPATASGSTLIATARFEIL
jgi:hypothetical protein